MPKLTWQVLNNTQADLDITQYVQSLNFTLGRPTALSPYSGNSATITMFSYGGRESSMNVNDYIFIKAEATGGTNKILLQGRVASRNFSDEPGTGINSTMTVSINDQMLQAGMANLQNATLSSATNQIDSVDNLLPQIEITDYGSLVSMSTGVFTVNANQRINEIIAADRGVMFNSDATNLITYFNPSQFDNLTSTAVTIGRTTSATQIAYQDLVRVEAASNSLFYTQATVTGSASTETKSSAALTTYGTRTFTATTAQSNLVAETAEWYANAFSDPEVVMLKLSFSDVAQNSAALVLINSLFLANKFLEVSYTPPGESAVTGYFWPEQITFNATTSKTTVDMLMSPLTYYANFILNDDIFGVLGGVPTYNSEIDYDEIGFIYDDSNVEQGSRLGV